MLISLSTVKQSKTAGNLNFFVAIRIRVLIAKFKKLYLNIGNISPISDIRTAITGALDIMQSLPEGLKIHFAEQTVALGSRLITLKAMKEAAEFLQIAVSSIDLLGRSIGSVAIR